MSSHICFRAHFIWSTAGRVPMIREEWSSRLYSYTGGILKARNCVLLSVGGTNDHIHLYVSLPATISLAETANIVKSNSSAWVKDTFREAHDFAWQGGYGAFSVSPTQDQALRTYIQNQAEHHRTLTFQEEYVEFLKRHGVDYDPRYLFD